MKISLLHDRGALILFDFEAAFPSVSQGYMIDMLRLLGIPPNIVKVVSALYHKCSCLIKIQGSSFEGFDMTSGVRQGCPLSPLLFVFVVDILLRNLEAITKGRDLVRAFADDIGMVVQNTRLTLPALFEAFGKFACFSGLNLNFKKTVCIPLWAESMDGIKEKMALLHEACKHIAYDDHGIYLGFAVGPGRNRIQWQKASDKFFQRDVTWVKDSTMPVLLITPLWSRYYPICGSSPHHNQSSFVSKNLPLPSCFLDRGTGLNPVTCGCFNTRGASQTR